MKKLSARERIKAVFSFEEPDRVPIFDYFHNDEVIEYYAGTRLSYENANKLVPRAISKALDLILNVNLPQRPRTYRNDDGFIIVQERWTDWIKERPFKNMEEFTKYIENDITKRNFWRPTKQSIAGFRRNFLSVQREIGDTVRFLTCSQIGLDIAYTNAGFEFFSYLAEDNAQLLSEWLEAMCNQNLRWIDAIADSKLSPVALVACDLGYKDKLLFSPKFLRKEYFPRLKKSVDLFHTHGIKCLFHSDGYIMDILPDLVATEIDGLNPLEKLAGMDLKKVKELYGDKLVLSGNIDCSQLLPYGSKEEVKKVVIQAIKDAASGSGYILSSSHSLHNAIPSENIVTMIETAKEYGKYPINI